MKFKQMTWLVIFTFCCAIVGPLLISTTASAAGTSDIVAELNNLYQYIDENDKTYLQQTRAGIGNLTDNDWNTILGPTVITSEVITAFGSEETAKAELKAFLTDFSAIYYSTDPTTLGTTIDTFRETHRATFQTLFGTDVTVDSLFTLLSNARSQIPNSIQAGDIDDLAFGTNDALVTKMPVIMKRALAAAITEPFIGKLSAIGWSTDMLIDTKTVIAGLIGQGNNAELALAKAAVRSETKLPIGAPTTFAVNDIIPNTILIMGRDATNLVEWQSSNSSVVEVTANAETGNYILTAKGPGTATLTAFRDVDVNNPAADGDWLFGYDVTVLEQVTPPILSSDATLSNLTVAAGTLKPVFSAAITEYNVVLPNGTSVAPQVAAQANHPGATVNIGQAASLNDKATITVTAENGITQKVYTLSFAVLTPVPAGGATIDASTAPVAIQVGPGAALPEISVTGGSAEVEIPAGTVVNGPAGWDGTIIMPVAKAVPSVTVSGSGVVVVEVGAGKDASGNDIVLTFEKPVRLLIPGQKGKTAAYTRNGNLVIIQRVISRDDATVAHQEIPATQEGTIDVNNDKVIWTKHFTEFVAYTPTPSGGGGGGGGTPFTGTAIKSSDGGKVSGEGATIEIPKNASTTDFKVKIEKVSDTSKLPLDSGAKLLGTVVDITTDKSVNFTKPVTITLVFDKSKIDTSKYDIAVYWFNSSSKKWAKLDNVKVDLDTGKVSGETTHFTKFAVIATPKAGVKPPVTPETPTVTLTDIAGHWAQADIQKLVAAGVISGYPNKTFKPDANISRAEFAVAMVKALKLAPKSGKVFNDTANHWAKDSIATAQAYGIINGYSDTKFGPNDKITREQMAVMVARGANLTATADAKTFTDSAKVSAWAKDGVMATSSNGIINGYPDGSFKPQANATRAEAVTVIAKVLK